MTVVPLFRTHPGRHMPAVPPSAPFPLAQESSGSGSLSCATDERCASIVKVYEVVSVWIYLSIERGCCQGAFVLFGLKIVKKGEFLTKAGGKRQITVDTTGAKPYNKC